MVNLCLYELVEAAVMVPDIDHLVKQGHFVLFKEIEGAIDHQSLPIIANYRARFSQQSEQQLVQHF